MSLEPSIRDLLIHSLIIPCICAESGGVCTSCGARVAISSQDRSEVRPPFAERTDAVNPEGQPSSSTTSSSAADARAAEAMAFKNRLVSANLLYSRFTWSIHTTVPAGCLRMHFSTNTIQYPAPIRQIPLLVTGGL